MDLPPHAYVPGRTARHDPALFAGLHRSVRPGMAPEDLARTDAWRAGLRFLRAGYFWEAHEALEPVWMQTVPNSGERHLVQALIQTANAALKLRMRRPKAAHRLCRLADAHLAACGARRGPLMGIDPADVRAILAEIGRTAEAAMGANRGKYNA